MKTHKARWYQNSPTTWILKEPARDGGAVLATIEERTYYGGPTKYVASTDPMCLHYSRYAAQRAARKAIMECKTSQPTY